MESDELVRLITRRVVSALDQLEGTNAPDAGENRARSEPAADGFFAPSPSGGHALPVGVSARHVHLCEADLFTLFGPHYVLKQAKTLMGGQFAAEEWVTLVGANLRAIERTRILGPLRDVSQVEISRTDGYALGINPPVRASGDLADAAPIRLAGPRGALYLEHGCIIAARHVHMSPADAARFGVADRQLVNLRLTGGRGGVMERVLVRVAPSYTLEVHIDTDEANAFGLASGQTAKLCV